MTSLQPFFDGLYFLKEDVAAPEELGTHILMKSRLRQGGFKVVSFMYSKGGCVNSAAPQ